MKLHEFPKIGESYYETRLENGLKLRVIPKRGFAKKYAFLAVDFGSIDTHFTFEGKRYEVPDGIAHYLEHKLFDLPEGNATDIFARYGGSPNAFTSHEMTAYFVSCTDFFEENLRTLVHMVMTPYFTEESVEKERGIIAQEIKMYTDSAQSRVGEELFRGMFTHHPARVPIAGSVESIEKITAQMLYDCYEAFYRPCNMMLCVAGDVDEKTVEKIAREECRAATTELPVRDYGEKETGVPFESFISHEMEISMPTFAIGFSCPPPEKDTMYRETVGDLAAEILMGESSELYERLYSEGLIDAEFSAGYENVKDACLLSAGGDSKDPEAVLEAILQEAERIIRGGFDLDLFERLKKSAIGRRTRSLDSFQSICYRSCAYEFEGTDYFDFPDVYARLKPEDVAAFLQDTVKREKTVLSIIVPKKKEDENEI